MSALVNCSYFNVKGGNLAFTLSFIYVHVSIETVNTIVKCCILDKYKGTVDDVLLFLTVLLVFISLILNLNYRSF